jgi:osmotically-inducible protein OsmY
MVMTENMTRTVDARSVVINPTVSLNAMALNTAAIKPSVAIDPASEAQTRLLARIKRAIRRKTSGGVQKLAVEMQAEVVLLRGHCVSFYCKQLAQQTAMGFLGDGAQLQNEIEVLSTPK